jgi:hypothetical protein
MARFMAGDRVRWVDPDGGKCSGNGVVTWVAGQEEGFPINDDTTIELKMDDGGEVEALPHELRRIRRDTECVSRT